MLCNGARYIDRGPTKQTAAPGEIGILTIRKKIFIEILAIDYGFVQRRSPIHRRSAAGTENLFRRFELPRVGLVCTAVQVPLLAQHDDACGVDRFSVHAEQLAARRWRLRMRL